MTPILTAMSLALVAAVLFGTASVVSKRGLATVDPQSGSMVSIGTTTLAFALTAPLWMHAADWFGPGFWVFVVNGLFHPLLSLYCAMQALRLAGPTVASTLAATAPLFAAATAVVFLGEALTTPIVIGTLATVLGVVTLSWSPGGFRGALRTALIFATGAALLRGINHSLGSYGLDLMPNAAMAGFVSFGTSWIIALAVYRRRTGTLPFDMPFSGARWFIATGIMVAIAIACMYHALGLADVTLVSPIIALYPFFTLLTSLAVGAERITPKVVTGVLCVVGGVVLLGLAAT